MRLPTWQSFGANHRMLRLGLNVWPPFATAGIRVEVLTPDFRLADDDLDVHLEAQVG